VILVTGGSGQLARALEAAAAGRAIRRVGRPEFDFDRPECVAQFLADAPAIVINAAAYTAVDRAESEPESAFRANRDGPATLARACADLRIPLIHISTDYVFDGLKGAPYVEADPTNPMGVYGASKLAGECAVRAVHSRAIVVRTSWVYDAMGKNFVLTMLNAATRTDRLRVVADQRGCPTAAPALAAALLVVADRLLSEPAADFGGIYHAAGTGETTWHGLALAAFDSAARYGRTVPTVEPIDTCDWPTPARRPPDSRLDCRKLADVFGVHLPHWEVSLADVIDFVFSSTGGATTPAAS
jgi:dTDP-4-dehydrorhamnose reductase